MVKKNDTKKIIGLLRWDAARCYSHVSRKDANEMVARGEASWVPGMAAVRLPRSGDPISHDPLPKKPPLKSTEDGYDKAKGPIRNGTGLSANPNQDLTERYVSALDSGTDSAVIVAVTAWGPRGLRDDSGLFG